MKTNRFSRTSIRIISFLGFLSLALAVSSIANSYKAGKYKLELELTREQTLSQLCESLDGIATALRKSMFSASSSEMRELSRELSCNADCAKLSLSSLDCGDGETDGIYTFLSQVGEYTAAVSKSKYDADKNAENLAALSAYADSLSEGLGNICDSYFDGTVSFEKTVSTLELYDGGETTLFSDGFTDTEQTLTDYPTLIYDGPFSEAQQQTTSKFTEGRDEITRVEAKRIASTVLDVNVRELKDDGDEAGTPYLYCFSTDTKSISITKLGGFVCYILNGGYAGETTISPEAAIDRAKQYLETLGYNNMSESYYSVYDGICTVNFAATQDGVTLYSDLIKVSIALDTGKAVALDARGYIMNHTARSIASEIITKQQAREKLNGSLAIGSSKLAMIPTDNSNEILCYEFLCTSGKSDALIYINAETGEEEDVLLLLYSDNGVLTK